MRFFFISTLLVISISAYSQKQGNIWYFGINAGINFSNGIPVAIFDGKTGTDVPLGSNQEGTAAISDSSGNLLFYTGGATIWNRYHNPMPNGNGIMGGVSSTQSSIIVPKPTSDNLFYVFTTDEFQSYSPPWSAKGYRYSIVDMCQDSGRGNVLANQKNILLLDSSTEKLAVCEDNFGNGYWIMGHKHFSSKFYAWHLTSAGLSAPIVSDIGTFHGKYNYNNPSLNSGSAQGQIKFNSLGTKIALALGNYDPSIIDIFDFNKITGVVSDFCHIAIDSLLFKRSYGLEFSPDGSKLYAGVSGGVGGPFLYQFDLNSGNCNSITTSAIKINQPTVSNFILGMQLAPDNKIYVVASPDYLDCINSPNMPGIAANYITSALSILPGKNAYTLPAFIAGYKYYNKIACDTTKPPLIDSICRLDIQKTKIFPNPFHKVFFVDKKPTVCRITINIYTVIGQLILQDRIINDGLNEIKLPNLSAGIYYYKFISNGHILLSGKILKQ